MRSKMLSVAVVALVSWWLGATYAAEEPEVPAADQQPKAYDVRLIPYVWFLSADGDVTARGVTRSFEADFSDVLDNLNLAFMLALEVTWDKFGFTVDGLYADFESETDTPEGNVTVNPSMFIGEAAVTYNLYRNGEDPAQGQVWSLDVLAGFRYWDLETRISLPMTDDIEESRDWFEGLIGASVRVALNPKWGLGFRVDYGVGNTESDLDQTTWNLIGFVDYRISEQVSLDFAYRYMNIDVEADDSDFEMDTDLFGPALAVTIRF